jgi:Fe2+ transport system protein FeoA
MKANTPKTTLHTLDQARANSTLTITSISGGWGVRQNLNEVGLHAGDTIRILRKAPFGGPLMVVSHGTKVAVGRQLAEKIKVEVIR